jgi:hypothetical protein
MYVMNYGRMHPVPVICWKKKLAHVDQRDADQRGSRVPKKPPVKKKSWKL